MITQETDSLVHLDGLESVLNLRRVRREPELDASLHDFVQW